LEAHWALVWHHALLSGPVTDKKLVRDNGRSTFVSAHVAIFTLLAAKCEGLRDDPPLEAFLPPVITAQRLDYEYFRLAHICNTLL
jgi:hypothetical protein